MSLIELLRRVALFYGLSDDELAALADLCREKRFPSGAVIVQQGGAGGDLYIIHEGQVEIVVMGAEPQRPIVVLGKGQILGEISLVDDGPRSATGRAAEPVTVQEIDGKALTALCERNCNIGYRVMRNLAADLAFKLRHRNLETP